MTIEQSGTNSASKPGPADPSVGMLFNQETSFETLIDEVCERLQDTRQQGYLKRIKKLNETLDALDVELDQLLTAQTSNTQTNQE